MAGLDPVCAAPTGDICGEGAVWSADEQSLYWTDINRFLIHRLAPDGSVRSWLFDEPVVSLALTTRRDKLLVALGSRLILWTPADDKRELLGQPLDGWPKVRFNDGRPDPLGRLVIGTMGNNVGPSGEGGEVAPGLGELYAVTSDGRGETLESGIGISNTICWSPDAAAFYFADTLANEIRAYPFDSTTGRLGTPQPFFTGFERGGPDGSAMDVEGCLWNCRYGGGCVVRLTPDGEIDSVIEMPCGNITTCTFGGTDLRTLFITTAAAGRAPTERLAGSLFTLRAPAPGLPERRFAL